jgi:phosphoglycolate phosphatase-like HAD superfamily hydrolase
MMRAMPLRAILLDLDGTLVDASDAIADGIVALATEHGLEIPDRAWAVGRVGFSPVETWQLLGAEDPESLSNLFRQRYLPLLPARTRVLPGAKETVLELAARGLRLGLATTRRTDSATETLRVAGMLEAVQFIGGGDLVARHKPDPEVVRLVLERLGCAPHEALMVGDTTADVAAAHAASVPCWAVLGGTHDEATLRAAGADLILSGGIAELTAALDRHPANPTIPPRRR